jgi:hypothetical protein
MRNYNFSFSYFYNENLAATMSSANKKESGLCLGFYESEGTDFNSFSPNNMIHNHQSQACAVSIADSKSAG